MKNSKKETFPNFDYLFDNDFFLNIKMSPSDENSYHMAFNYSEDKIIHVFVERQGSDEEYLLEHIPEFICELRNSYKLLMGIKTSNPFNNKMESIDEHNFDLYLNYIEKLKPTVIIPIGEFKLYVIILAIP